MALARASQRRRPRLRRAARRLLALLLAFAALVMLALASVNLPWVRAWLAREASGLISRQIAGTLTITRLDHVGFVSVAGVDAELAAADGRRVLTLRGLRAELDALAIARSSMGGGPLEVHVERLAAAALSVDLHSDPGGELALLGAVEPHPIPRQEPAAPSVEPPPVLRFDAIALDEIRVRGAPEPIAAADVELRDLAARVRSDGQALRFELERVRAEASGLPVVDTLSGELSAQGVVPRAGSGELHADARWRGRLAQIPVDAAVVLAGERLSGFVRTSAEPQAVTRLWPDAGWSPALQAADVVALRVAFEGPVDDLTVRAALESDAGELYVDGQVDLVQRTGRATLLADALDASRWLAVAPEMSVRFVAAVAFAFAQGQLQGRLALRSGPGRVAGRPLPELALAASLGARSIEAQLRADLSGGEARLVASLPRDGGGSHRRLALELHASASDMSRVLAQLGLPSRLRGRGTLHASGRLDLAGEPGLIAGRLEAELRGLRSGALALGHASLAVSAHGPLDELRLEGSLEGRRLALPHYRVSKLRALAAGRAEELRIRGRFAPAGAAPIRFSASLAPGASSLSNLVLDAGSGRDPLQITLRRARATPRGYSVEGLEVRGPGRLALDGMLRGGALHLRTKAEAFSAAAVARRLGLALPLPAGVADLSLELDTSGARISGALRGRVTELARGPLRGAVLEADLVAERGVLRGLARGVAPGTGRVLVRVPGLELPRRWQPSALTSVEGQIELIGHADLAQLARIWGLAGLAERGLAGALDARLELSGDGRGEPRVHIALAARDLVGVLQPGGAEARVAASADEPAGVRQQVIDLDLSVDLDGSELRAQAALIDAQGRPLASVHGATPLPLARLLRDPASFDPRSQPVNVRLRIPERRLAEFPEPLRFAGVDGVVRAEASARGRLGRPELTAHVALSDLRLEGSQRALPLALELDARLRDQRLSARASARDERRQLVSLEAEANLESSAQRRWHDVALDLRSNGLPLEALGALLGQDVAGELYGALSLRLEAGAPRAQGTLWVKDPSVRGFRQQQARWTIDAGADAFATELAIEQDGGGAHATLSGPWRWTGLSTPSLDRRLVRATLEAERFDLRALSSLLPEQTRDLRGRLDAQLRIDPGQPGVVSGGAALREGNLYVAALGQEFRDIALDARLDGPGRLAIERLSARASYGRVTAQGSVELDGLDFRHAELDVDIPRGDPFPLALEGVTVASAWGRFDVSARQEPEPPGELPVLRVNVRVPRLQILLPELSPRSIQELADDPTIATGTYLSPERFVSLPLPPYTGAAAEPDGTGPGLVVRAEVELGDEVWVEQEPLLEVKLVGSVSLELRDELTVAGQLQLARGSIDVQGRSFQIEHGEISFAEAREPTNPTLVATAVYTAPEGTRVYAEFVGPVETGELTLRSEPPLRDDQILSLLLFGSTDGSFGSAGSDISGDPLSSVGGTALVAGGNVFARGLNLELRRLTSLDIQTRIGEREGEPQPEVAVQLTPRVTAELAYRLEAPTPGRAPDRSYLTLDLRLFRNWSLSTTIGDAGSFLLDLLWRYRY